MAKPSFIIFDCDGVLVDSETIANRVAAELKTELGFQTSTEEEIRQFTGLGPNSAAMRKELARLPQNYLEIEDERCHAAFAKELTAIAGIAEVLDSIAIPKCVASSSELHWIEYKLSVAGLLHHFPNRIFSGQMVPRGKPDPDLFLYAAERMGWSPSRCLVIEDSKAGVQAGVAAGMAVYGFVGASHIRPGHRELLLDAGAQRVFAEAKDILQLVR